jgi:hypothetical protein
MASVTYRMKDYTRAEPLYEESVRRFRETVGPDHPMTISAMSGNAGNLLMLKQYPRAEALLQEALRRGTKVQGRAWALDETGNSFVRLYFRTNRFPEAEKIGLELYRMRDSSNGTTHQYTRTAAEMLDSIYTRMNRPADAAKYRELAKAPQ